jgi:hypothetical protein
VTEGSSSGLQSSPEIDTTVSHSARVWDYWLGGKDAIVEAAARRLDFKQPIAITMLGVLWHIVDDGEAKAIIDRYLGAVPSGSYFAIAQPTIEITGERMAEAIRHWNEFGTPPGIHRTPQQIAALFDGLELVEPGVVSCTRWRPEPTLNGVPDEMDLYVAVGRKP